MIAVWFYKANPSQNWMEVFYESLSDYLHHRYQLAIFKLASSAELWADGLFERYLKSNAKLDEKVVGRIMREQRSAWGTKFDRAKDLVSIFLDEADQKRFANSKEPFRKFVREPRNDFAHRGTSSSLKHEDAGEAYKAAFDVLWTMDQLEKFVP
jgi:hypothetical protein